MIESKRPIAEKVVDNEPRDKEDKFLTKNAEAIKRKFAKFGSSLPVSESIKIPNLRQFNIVSHPIERDDATGLYTAVEQFDGSVIRVIREEREGITVIKDLVATDYQRRPESSILRHIPRNYFLVEGVLGGHGVMYPARGEQSGLIMLPVNFFSSVLGRLVAAHEIGHAIDFEKNPIGEAEVYRRLQSDPDAVIDRERKAWKDAERFVANMRKDQFPWLPPEFDKKEWDKAVAQAMATYRKLRGL